MQGSFAAALLGALFPLLLREVERLSPGSLGIVASRGFQFLLLIDFFDKHLSDES